VESPHRKQGDKQSKTSVNINLVRPRKKILTFFLFKEKENILGRGGLIYFAAYPTVAHAGYKILVYFLLGYPASGPAPRTQKTTLMLPLVMLFWCPKD